MEPLAPVIVIRERQLRGNACRRVGQGETEQVVGGKWSRFKGIPPIKEMLIGRQAESGAAVS